MEHLTGINIRSGIEELNLPIKDIFKIKEGEFGDHKIKDLYLEGDKKILEKHPKIEEEIDKKGYMVFADKKTKYVINDYLTAYVFDSYFACRHKESGNKIKCEKSLEIEFVNSEILNFDMFCHNVMQAQAFTGKFGMDHAFAYPFIGVGDFTMDEYYLTHALIMNGNVNLMYFFVYYKKVLAAIDEIGSASYDEEVKTQKKYLSKKEYDSHMREIRKNRKLIREQIKEEFMDMEDDEFFDDEDLED